MKKLSLFILGIFASISIFANGNEIVKPYKGKEVVKKLNEYLKKNNISLKNLKDNQEKIEGCVYNTTYFFLVSTLLDSEENIFYCDTYLLNYYVEVLETWKKEVTLIEVDDDNNIVLEATLASWLETVSYSIGECPEIGGYI